MVRGREEEREREREREKEEERQHEASGNGKKGKGERKKRAFDGVDNLSTVCLPTRATRFVTRKNSVFIKVSCGFKMKRQRRKRTQRRAEARGGGDALLRVSTKYADESR